MKYITGMIAMLLIFSGCGSRHGQTAKGEDQKMMNECPEEGRCEIRRIEGKSIVISQDEFGKTLYQLVDNAQKDIIFYEYVNPGPKGVQDGMYREEVLFEVSKGNGDIELQGRPLLASNILFGVFCFCKDKAGYYRVTSGKVSRKSNAWYISLPDIVQGQKTKEIRMELD